MTNEERVKEYWLKQAAALLMDQGVEPKDVAKYAPRFATALKDYVEDWVNDEIPRLEQDAEDAARDAYWDRKIDEERGK